MKNLCFFLIIVLNVVIISKVVEAQPIIANHTTVDISGISEADIADATDLKVVIRRASVGGNISDGLDALEVEDAKYDRSNWLFSYRGNPPWDEKVDDIVAFTAAHTAEYNIFSMKFCWIDPNASFTYYRDAMLGLESTYTDKKFIWWTMPIYRDEDGDEANRQAFNENVRNYANTNNKFLFDIADIESHNSSNVVKTDGSGNELAQGEWIVSDGGHLNDEGAKRVARAWWWLMVNVAQKLLPVEMISFTASYTGTGSNLHWSTATEVNNYGFDIEWKVETAFDVHSSEDWLKIGFIPGSGNSNSIKNYSFTDNTLSSRKNIYRLKQIDLDGKFEYSKTVEINIENKPTEITLEQNYPNPFNPSTVISYQLSMINNVSLKIYDILGREIITMVNEQQQAGKYKVQWDGKNSAGSKVGSGIYFYQLKTFNGYINTKKMLMLK
jgi:hypothetical protein